jgi:heme oxygenase
MRALAAHLPEDAPPALSSPALSSLDFEYVDSRAAAVGAQYVLEGSSLGGQFLSRQLFDRLQLTPERGGAYFAAYGAATGRRWQAFRRWGNLQLGDPRSTRLAVEAARLTFSRFGKALAGSEL